MLSRKNKLLLLKLFGLFTVVRGYNVMVLALAQYLAAIYIFSPDSSVREVLFDPNFFLLVVASSLCIASGYIINSFYDAEKDLINRPNRTALERLISQQSRLFAYFSLNFLAVFAAVFVSFRAAVFFGAYIFGIWIYSVRLKKLTLVGNLFSALLTITPFFAVFIYYENFQEVIFAHATVLFLFLLMREFTKDLENLKGDLVKNYRTIPVVYGEQISKVAISILSALTIVIIIILVNRFPIGYMYLYYYGCVAILLLLLVFLWKSKSKIHYVLLHYLLKIIIVSGVFSILLIDVDLLLHKIF
ncbi:MAG: geranylgeranylglycerol-phosphate geranylgeranyltransferase [Flavobacteriaceae bacterium]|nr:geranylgeranylglycerol-phosphate geranylgeranyltransferase [Flavobacteriaceae bacterium]MDZ4146976.1 geranylgeranylglycerol-phosphate geranylgeranyltransferase [Flavobacteriaceae bacterium]